MSRAGGRGSWLELSTSYLSTACLGKTVLEKLSGKRAWGEGVGRGRGKLAGPSVCWHAGRAGPGRAGQGRAKSWCIKDDAQDQEGLFADSAVKANKHPVLTKTAMHPVRSSAVASGRSAA